MTKIRILSAVLIGLIFIGLVGCGTTMKTAEKETENPSQTASVDVTSDNDSGNDITADSSDADTTMTPTEETSATQESNSEEKSDTQSPASTQGKASEESKAETPATSRTPQNTETSKTAEKPVESSKPAETSKPQESSSPPATESPKPTEPVKSKSIYDYEFDIEAIRNELISIGQGMGLTHITSSDGTACTPSNSSWAIPVTASKDYQGSTLEKKLKEYVRSMPSLAEAYGGGKLEYFTIYVESLGGGSYRIYFLG